ncbi:MAG: glycosyltransferase family 39 protein [Bacteroidetes bacterium]|nr:glycosyltransferase family 39 protein [Bacteroidota bacterium]
MNYKRKTVLLIAAATVLRCIIASSIALGNDEVYYRMYAQYLQANYFDHPPAVGWLIRCSTVNLLFTNELFVRLGAIVCAAMCTWLIFLCGKKINSERTGYFAAVMYTACIYSSIIAGTFILPDSPQLVCWLAGLYILLGIVTDSSITKSKKRKLFWFGAIMGLGMLCKIHTAFLWLGFLLYALMYNRQWFKQPALYIAGFITVLFFYPVIQWNINHHFVTYLYHSNRVNVAGGGIDIAAFGSFAAGQVFYYNPVLFFLFAMALIATLRKLVPLSASYRRLLLLTSLPLIVLATGIAIFKTVLPHWTGPAYIALLLLTACHLQRNTSLKTSTVSSLPAVLRYATGFIVVLALLGIAAIHFYPGTLGKKEKTFYGEGDFTLDMYGWHQLKNNMDAIMQQDAQQHVMKNDAAIVCNKWFPAAHLDVYVAMPLHKRCIAIGDTNDIHQYVWINAERKALQQGDDAYCIVPSNEMVDVKAVYQKYFSTIIPGPVIEQRRSGTICRYFYVWRLKNFIAQ